jgi:hypothetical protein
VEASHNLAGAGMTEPLVPRYARGRKRRVAPEVAMPFDRGDLGEIAEEEEDEQKRSGRSLGSKRRFDEFDCPTCSANNPIDFGNGDEIPCAYCGLAFLATVDEEGNLRLREL